MGGRSREGAWIEIGKPNPQAFRMAVAPVRERGLKSAFYRHQNRGRGRRSREGAWIEMILGWVKFEPDAKSLP